MPLGKIMQIFEGEIEANTIEPTTFKLPEKYILSVSTLEPRKNFITLLQSFYHFKSLYTNMPHKLVIVGKDAWGSDVLKSFIDRNPQLKSEIIFTGYLPEEELYFVYKNADLFVFIPIYEGFGIPPLEAMAFSIPTIVSDISVLRETCSDGSLFVDHKESRIVCRNMFQVLSDKNLKESLIEKGKICLAKYKPYEYFSKIKSALVPIGY